MRDENALRLDARIWFKDAAGNSSLAGERFCKADGGMTVVWQVDPKTLLGVMWFEKIGTTEGEPSAS